MRSSSLARIPRALPALPSYAPMRTFGGALWLSLEPAKIRREFSAERYRLAGGAPPPLDPPGWFSGGARAAREKNKHFFQKSQIR